MKSVFDDMFKENNNLLLNSNDIRELVDYFNRKSGWVYIAKTNDNPYLKIGRTSKNPLERAKTLSGAGVFDEFEILYSVRSMNASRLEASIHNELKNNRVKKEFFLISLDKAIDTLEKQKQKDDLLLGKFFNTKLIYESVDFLELAMNRHMKKKV